MRLHREWCHFFAGFTVAYSALAPFFNFLHAQYALDGKMQDPRAFEFFTHFFLRGVNDQPIGSVEYKARDLQETPQPAGGYALAE